MIYKCGCKVHFDDNGKRIAVDEFCAVLDPVFNRVMLAGFTHKAWRWMEQEMRKHYQLIREAANSSQTPAG